MGRLFAMMGILYGWKKEYLLNEMTFGQIVMYLNEGIKLKYPSTEKAKGSSLVGASAEEIKRRRDELRRQYGQNIEGL